jgi:hypothetical protein
VNGSTAGTYGGAGSLILRSGHGAIALSGSADWDGTAAQAPSVKTSAEGHLFIPRTDVALHLYGAVELGELPEAYSAGGGIGATVHR